MLRRNLLGLENVTKTYRTGVGFSRKIIRAIDEVSFALSAETPAITSLVGQSGSGKTTIARLILGLISLTSGKILYKGRELTPWLKKDKRRYRQEVQAIFQDPYSIYNPFYKIDRLFDLTIKQFKLASSKEEKQDLIVRSLETLGLRPQDILGRYPHQLSGGERQRVMLARILLIRPNLLIADEPVSMIDVSLRSIFLRNLTDLKDKLGMTCLYITHDLNTARYASADMIVLCRGRIVEMGKTEQVIENPLHPYTELLISSIPVPDPTDRWKGRLTRETVAEILQPSRGCLYFNRCDKAKPICKENKPNLVEVEAGHKIACLFSSK